MDTRHLSPDTQLVHAGRSRNSGTGCVNPPVIRGSTVLHDSFADMVERTQADPCSMDSKLTYGTHGSETHRAFFEALMTLEGPRAAGAWAFSSGLGACTQPLFAFVKAGCHALFADSIYGPTREFAEEILTKMGVDVEFFDPLLGAGVEALIRRNTTFLMMETPGSHSFELMDVPAIARVCRAHGVRTAIDNTWATPLYFKPLDVGVDMVIHAATKYINGHSDVLMGVVICNAEVWPDVHRVCSQLGSYASCDDVYLAYRGLHTMSVRVRAASASTRRIVEWLIEQPQVERVLWPALPSDPSYPIWKRDFTGATSLFGVILKPEYAGKVGRIVDAIRIFGRGYSWGGFESLLIAGYGKRDVRQMPFDRMFRVAVGLEDAQDLIADLRQALAALED